MADKKISELTAITNLSSDDLLLIVNDPAGTPASRKITVGNVFGNVVSETTHKANVINSGTTVTNNANTFHAGQMVITANTPGSNNTTTEGRIVNSIWADENYIYFAANTSCIKRATLSAFS